MSFSITDRSKANGSQLFLQQVHAPAAVNSHGLEQEECPLKGGTRAAMIKRDRHLTTTFDTDGFSD